jgi:hypothetical protein
LRGFGRLFADHAFELGNQIPVGPSRLLLALLQLVEQFLDAVDGGQDDGDGVAGDRHAVTEFSHQRLGGMRQRFQPRQTEKTAGPLDGVDQAKDVVENLGVVRILLESNELHVDDIETLVGLGQELTQQIVHETPSSTGTRRRYLSGAGAACCESV